MVGGVKAATCDTSLPLGEDGACKATVTVNNNTQYFDSTGDAWKEARINGGELVIANPLEITTARTLDKDININIIGDGVLTLNEVLTVANGASLTINGKTEVTLASKTLFDVQKGGSLTLNGVDINVSSLGLTPAISAAGNVTITNSSVKGAQAAIIEAKKDAVISLDGTFTGKNIVNATGAATVNVVGGDYTASDIAFMADNGVILNLNGGKISATKEVVKMTDAKVTVSGSELTSDTMDAIFADGTVSTASLTINEGSKLVSNAKYALAIGNANAKYNLTGGTYESPKQTAAIWLKTATCLNSKGNAVIANLQGIITGGSYLNKIVATIEAENGATIDVSTQLVKAGVAIETKDGYKVVGEGSQANTNEQTTAPESQEPTGNTADAKNPGTSDNFMSLISMVTASAAGLFITLKCSYGTNGRWR